MTAFLTKPLDPALLVRTVHMHVNRVRGTPVGDESQHPAKALQDESEWPEIEGISTSEARKLLQGDTALFFNLLRRFAKEYGGEGFELSPEYAADQRKVLMARVHKLRGSAGMLGATTLRAIAEGLENTLRRFESEPEKSNEILSASQELLVSLNAAVTQLISAFSPWGGTPVQKLHSVEGEGLEPQQDAPREEMDEEQAQKLLAFLQLLNRQDFAVMEQVDALSPDLIALLGSQKFGVMREAIHGLDFAAAAQMLAIHLPVGE